MITFTKSGCSTIYGNDTNAYYDINIETFHKQHYSVRILLLT